MDSVKLLGQLVKDLGGKGFEDWPQGFWDNGMWMDMWEWSQVIAYQKRCTRVKTLNFQMEAVFNHWMLADAKLSAATIVLSWQVYEKPEKYGKDTSYAWAQKSSLLT